MGLNLGLRALVASAFLSSAAVLSPSGALAVELSLVSGAVGTDLAELETQFKGFTEKTGHTVKLVSMPASSTDQFGQYRLWLSAQNADIDVYRTDVIWAPQLAEHFVDLTAAMKDEVGKHFPSVIESQTVDGKLVAAPIFTDAPALYYRKDLLEKHGKQPPKTWMEMTETAKAIVEAEKGASPNMVGFVFQGAPYEGLTCDALEWVKSNGGGQIVEPDGTISINNEKAVAALEMAKGWVGTIAPPGVLSYKEEESRGVWQTGEAVFMRNWPYAFSLGNSGDSAVKDKFDVVPLPAGEGEGAGSAATLGGWNVAVSKYSTKQEAAIELVKYLASAEQQKFLAINSSKLPTIEALYDDKEIAEKQPVIPRWKAIFQAAVPRPSAPTKKSYNEVSKEFWTAVNNTLSGNGTAAENLEELEVKLEDLKGSGW